MEGFIQQLAVGYESLWAVLLLVTIGSVLGNLYRPLVATYQALTLHVPGRELAVAGAAMLLSLGLAHAGKTLPPWVPPLVACSLAGGYAGMVVVEYAAWARANPAANVGRVLEFDARAINPRRKDSQNRGPIDGTGAMLAALAFGLSYGLFTTGREYSGAAPGPDSRVDAPLCLLVGLVGMPSAVFWASTSLTAVRLPNPARALLLAWDAVVVFLTYPNTAHPLAHRLHTRWLRPQAVRVGVTGVVFITTAAAVVAPLERKGATAAKSKAAAEVRTAVPAPQTFQGPVADNAALARTFGWDEGNFPNGGWNAPPGGVPPAPPADPPAAKASESWPAVDDLSWFLRATLATVVCVPVLIAVMIAAVGSAALPTYFDSFENPKTSR